MLKERKALHLPATPGFEFEFEFVVVTLQCENVLTGTNLPIESQFLRPNLLTRLGSTSPCRCSIFLSLIWFHNSENFILCMLSRSIHLN